ncbi:tripartite motif-containing protein 54-like [Ambystoma mexicanum]|uniref:tripartite motif-containing protein 54-like n=1 Tax=Ambystoma mexicanum TaxID=8296 RepID=UPI0037E94A5D
MFAVVGGDGSFLSLGRRCAFSFCLVLAAMEPLGKVLSCPVCLELLRPPVLVLSCSHNFCKPCVEEILLRQDCTHVNGHFSCPICRKVIYLRGRGTDGLQRNILVENVLEKFKEELANVHAKEENQLLQTCEEHGEIMNLVCLNDNEPICGTCKLFGNHEPHKVAKLSEIYAVRKVNFAEDIQQVFEKSENAKQATKDTEKLMNDLTSVAADTTVMIDTIGGSLLNEISRRIASLKVKLYNEHSLKLGKLKSVANELEAPQHLYNRMKRLFEDHTNSVQFLKEDKKLRHEMEKLTCLGFPPAVPQKENISIRQYFEELIKGVHLKDFVSSKSDRLLSRTADIYGAWRSDPTHPTTTSIEFLDETFCRAIVSLFWKSSDLEQDYSNTLSLPSNSSGNNNESSCQN